MQPALRSSIPDASLAVFPVNGENSHQGLAGRNPAPNQVREVCNFTVLLGLQSAAVLNRVGSRSTGKERDQESGNDYFGARYYASSMGRWLSPDWSPAPTPIPYATYSDPQSLNLYNYMRDNPLGGIDPDGHGWWKDFFNGLANATYRPVITLVHHPIITGKAIGNMAVHPVATVRAMRHGVVTTT